ncbi:ABC-2 transporter permease [Bacillus sp. FSL M8-0052]|uniref:ABC-2 transporter permease n=1 Tax=Bacillus sp. FSL M8-0052 TaxID=2978203 RepID=UPI002E77F46A|nr:ABC-2 transporter permease [Bacillus glycinifermentans]
MLLLLHLACICWLLIVFHDLNDQIREFIHMLLTLQNTKLYLIVAISVITLYGCSWLLSIRIYRNKVF